MQGKFIFIATLWALSAIAAESTLVRGFTITEWEKVQYDAAIDPLDPAAKTQAQHIVDKLFDLGVRQINLSPRAIMRNPWTSEVEPVTPASARADERSRYLRLIRYIQSKGMKVGIRPIFFVVDNAGKTPYTEEVPPTYGELLRAASNALRVLEKDTAALSTQVPLITSKLDTLLGLLTASAGGRPLGRSENWLFRRVTNLKARALKLPALSGEALSREALRMAAKADLIGSKKDWWHGNIEPEDPSAWFDSFKTYLDQYLPLSRIAKVDEFTIGAELYSMTVGIEDRWDEQPYGFPLQWLNLLRYVKQKLPTGCRVMYDINFTDDKLEAGGIEQYGGEFARWKYRLADLANPNDPKQLEAWKTLVAFWKELDAVGVDMYRSLATPNQKVPADYPELVKLLQGAADRYASQMDNALFEIENTQGINVHKLVILKEIGFRSVTNGFINPFVYAGERGELNLEHQAAAYEATFRAFWGNKWDWFKGIVFWDASIDQSRHGHLDLTFSPIGKRPTEKVLGQFFRD